jgi:hypothetical protein
MQCIPTGGEREYPLCQIGPNGSSLVHLSKAPQSRAAMGAPEGAGADERVR